MLNISKGYLILTAVIILWGQTIVFAQTDQSNFDDKTLSYKGQSAYQDLLTTKTFTFAAFGAAAAPFRSTKSLANLLQEKHPETALLSVFKKANPEGQIYALIGFQVIKSASFKPLFAEFKKTLTADISSEDGGCDSERLILKKDEVIKKLESGEYAKRFKERFGDLKSQQVTVNEEVLRY